MDIKPEDIYLELESAYNVLSSENNTPPEYITLQSDTSFCKAFFKKDGELYYFLIDGKRENTTKTNNVKHLFYRLEADNNIILKAGPLDDFYKSLRFQVEVEPVTNTKASMYKIEHNADSILPDLQKHLINTLEILDIPYTGEGSDLRYKDKIVRPIANNIDLLVSAYESINTSDSPPHIFLKGRGNGYDVIMENDSRYENEHITVSMYNKEDSPNCNEKFLKALELMIKAGVDFSDEWIIYDNTTKPGSQKEMR